MSIEIIVGAPGAGKTTYAVATRVAAEAKREITLDAEASAKLGLEPGAKITRRVVVSGIRGLVIPHERLPHLLTRDHMPAAEIARYNAVRKVDGHDEEEPVLQRLPGSPPIDCMPCVENWWLWCQPGDFIVVDEAQFLAPRGALGRKPMWWLKALAFHRHYGVDFLFITQHPQLIDTEIRHLCNLQRYIRSVLGSPLCMVYTWDHAANPERINLADKSQFIRRAKHYALFHSSVAHIKPSNQGRKALVLVPILGAVVFAGFLHFKEKFAPAPTAAAAPVLAAGPARPGQGGASPAPDLARVSTRVAGCWQHGAVCRCFDEGGFPVLVPPNVCATSASSFDGVVAWVPRSKRYDPPPPPSATASGGVAAAMKAAML